MRGDIINVVYFLEVHWNASFKVEKEKDQVAGST